MSLLLIPADSLLLHCIDGLAFAELESRAGYSAFGEWAQGTYIRIRDGFRSAIGQASNSAPEVTVPRIRCGRLVSWFRRRYNPYPGLPLGRDVDCLVKKNKRIAEETPKPTENCEKGESIGQRGYNTLAATVQSICTILQCTTA